MTARDIRTELQRRKDAKEDACDSCDGKGGFDPQVCKDCLGQGVLLTKAEYFALLELGGFNTIDMKTDWLLDAPAFDETGNME